jgi:mono/diheme cytochrome c family protein
MRRHNFIIGLLAVGVIRFGLGEGTLVAADVQTAPAAGGAPPAAITPVQRVDSTPTKGQLKNPYTNYLAVSDEGHRKYMAYGCNGCHGGGGGGGMGPPLTHETWIYGSDDDTLFRLITLGTDALQKQGYTRKGSEVVVGPMMPFGQIIKTDDDLWKIIAWIRAMNPSSLKPSTVPPPPPN